ncbi:thiol:disulfide interchange protein TlpA [Brucellaceae bacterium C25G]
MTNILKQPRIIILAAVAGLLAGVGGVYVIERPSGNDISANFASGNSDEDKFCAAKAGTLENLNVAAGGDVAAMRAADKPISLAQLAFTDSKGQKMTLGDFKGKTLLVNLWATWCAPCRAEMPALDRLQQMKGSDDFEVVALNIDTGDNTKPVDFLNEIGVEHLALYRDATLNSFNELKRKGLAFGLPVTLVVDKDGCQISSMNGPAEWDRPDAIKLIDAARSL